MGTACGKGKKSSQQETNTLLTAKQQLHDEQEMYLSANSILFNHLSVEFNNRLKLKENNVISTLICFQEDPEIKFTHLPKESLYKDNSEEKELFKILKVVLDFKNLFCYFKESQQKMDSVNRLKQLASNFQNNHISIKKKFIVQQPISNFMKEYAMFTDLSNNYIPLLVLDSQDIRNQQFNKRFKIFIHSDSFYELNGEDYYQKNFEIKYLVGHGLTVKTKTMKQKQFEVNQQEMKVQFIYQQITGNCNVLILHKKGSSEDIQEWLNIMKMVLLKLKASQMQIDVFISQQLKEYLMDLLPQFFKKGLVTQDSNNYDSIQRVVENKVVEKKKKQPSNRCEQFKEMMLAMRLKMGQKNVQQYETCMNTIIVLLENIVKEDSDKFRQIKMKNQNIMNKILRHQNGTQCLKLAGFVENKELEVYQNNVDVKNLKLIIRDLELARKNVQLQFLK